MRVLAVTSWGGACGIANYAEMLRDHLSADIEFVPCPMGLDPTDIPKWSQGPEVLWLNYHRGLHSRWTPEEVARHKKGSRRVVITFHDTYGERPPDDLTQQLHDLADAFVVHEPCEGLEKQILIRQGVPGPPWKKIFELDALHWKCYPDQPILGTVGFNFPWKNFDRLAEVTAACGWAYVVCSNNATDEDEARWRKANPWIRVLRGFRPTDDLVSALAYCDVTCFSYECANSGTSGAIRLGLAARKPVIAWTDCRQFRDLKEAERFNEFGSTIVWNTRFENLPYILKGIPIQRCDPGIVALAHRDSWVNQGQRYAEVFRQVLA